jgi:hypothetical protein
MKFWSNSDTPSGGSHVPEKRLLAAVLQRAITDFLTGEGEVQEGARIWLMEDEPTDAPLSFRFICEALDLDCDSLRKAIAAQSNGQAPGFAQEAVL